MNAWIKLKMQKPENNRLKRIHGRGCSLREYRATKTPQAPQRERCKRQTFRNNVADLHYGVGLSIR
jgi:hypothetical protein